MKKFFLLFLALTVSLFFIVSNTWAERVDSKTEKAVEPHVHKFSRGLVNVGTAPFELPKQMIKKAQEGNGLAGEFAGYLTGIVTGIGWTFCRFGSGVVDIVSAPFPGNDEGLIKPEFITDEKILSEP
jgi:putative exosortase-associated protein (TIGR04073 family)